MKKYIISILLSIPAIMFAQETGETVISRNNLGEIKSVQFAQNDNSVTIPSSAEMFFTTFLNTKTDDTFQKRTLRSHRPDITNEYYQQFYKGIKVERGEYVFHYRKGKIEFAHGNFVRINSLNTKPSINVTQAIKAFAAYKGFETTDTTFYHTELLVKQIPEKDGAPQLVYKISAVFDNMKNDEIVYVNAHSGKIEITSPLFNNSSATATFHKQYGDTVVLATTEYKNNKYYLEDHTRGNGIYTQDCGGGNDNSTSGTDITNSNNIWYKNDLLTDNQYYALDVHWAMQKIYDYLLNTYNINSLDDNGMALRALINSNATVDAHWNNNTDRLHIGQQSPRVTLDVIAHELGHGISSKNINWDNSVLEQKSMNEGLSDIWAVIMDYRNGKSQTDVWRLGEEQGTVRDFTNVSSIAFEYNSYNYNNHDDPHYKGGVFVRWFYLLVNGGIHESSPAYNVETVGMNLAEELLVNAIFGGYLYGTTSFMDVRNRLIAVAESMNNFNLKLQVQNAWHAVGVGDRYFAIAGSNGVCSSATYTLVNPLNTPQTTIEWSVSNNCLQIVSGQGTNSVTVAKQNDGVCVLTANYLIGNLVHYSVSKTLSVGTPDLLDIHFNAADNGEGYWNGGMAGNNIEVEPPFLDFYSQYEYEIYKFDNNWNPILYSHFYNASPIYEVSLPIGWYSVWVRGIHDSGYSDWIDGEVEMMDNWDYGLSYDPSSETLTVTLTNSLSITQSSAKDEQSKSSSKYEIQIWNSNNMVKRFTTDLSTFQISLSGLPSGIYIVRVIKDGKSYSRKFVK